MQNRGIKNVSNVGTVSGFRLEGEVLHWDSMGESAVYRLIDTEYNVTYTTHNMFDMTKRNLLIGVYPASVKSLLMCDIPYLSGEGTKKQPYEIKTPFDLRAIDYYEMKSAESGERNNYKIVKNLDYDTVGALDGESNLFTLKKPFRGVLDGDGKTLLDISAHYDGGYFALFDFVAKGGVVKNITFLSPVITNRLQSADHPLDASIATVANRNYGEISNINVTGAKYASAGGEVCGIASHNFGIVRSCRVDGEFIEERVGLISQACYEMAGLVTENGAGGIVADCTAGKIAIRGAECTGEDGGKYRNVRSAGGVVSVNRAGGLILNCGYNTVVFSDVGNSSAFEYGGVVAYNAGTVKCGDALGTMTVNGELTAIRVGEAQVGLRGTLVGKNDGTVE